LGVVASNMASQEENPQIAGYRRKVARELGQAASQHLALAEQPGSSVPLSPDQGAPALPYPGSPGGSPPPAVKEPKAV